MISLANLEAPEGKHQCLQNWTQFVLKLKLQNCTQIANQTQCLQNFRKSVFSGIMLEFLTLGSVNQILNM